MRLQRLIVPTDFSASAEHAFQYAIELALAFGATVHLVHIYRLPHADIGSSVQLPMEQLDQLRVQARGQLDQWVEKAQRAGVSAHGDLMSGDAARAIARLAEKEGADLIVMGTRGLTGLKHLVLGSVAERTLRFAPCPVLTIPRRPEAARTESE